MWLVIWGYLVYAPGKGLTEAAELRDLSAQELHQLLKSKKTVLLINPLPNLLYRQGHIPGSVNIRWHSLETSPLMTEDKRIPVVTYCMGPR